MTAGPDCELGPVLSRHRKRLHLSEEELAECLHNQGVPATGEAIRQIEACGDWPFPEAMRRPFVEALRLCLDEEAMEAVTLAMARDIVHGIWPGADPFSP